MELIRPTNVVYNFDHNETKASIKYDQYLIDQRIFKLKILRNHRNSCVQINKKALRSDIIIKNCWPYHV